MVGMEMELAAEIITNCRELPLPMLMVGRGRVHGAHRMVGLVEYRSTALPVMRYPYVHLHRQIPGRLNLSGPPLILHRSSTAQMPRRLF